MGESLDALTVGVLGAGKVVNRNQDSKWLAANLAYDVVKDDSVNATHTLFPGSRPYKRMRRNNNPYATTASWTGMIDKEGCA